MRPSTTKGTPISSAQGTVFTRTCSPSAYTLYIPSDLKRFAKMLFAPTQPGEDEKQTPVLKKEARQAVFRKAMESYQSYSFHVGGHAGCELSQAPRNILKYLK